MNRLAEQIKKTPYADKIISDRLIAHVVGGSDDRRYGLIKRAVQEGALKRIKRGVYVLDEPYRVAPVHPFCVAHALVAGSYVSMETALSFHGWIPEAVYSTVSITPGRKSKMINHSTFGTFSFHPLALHRSAFLDGVDQHRISTQSFLIASPLRAVMDLAAFHKWQWQNLDWLMNSLRIDQEALVSVRAKDFRPLRYIYKQKGANDFLSELTAAIVDIKASQVDAQ